MSVKMRFHELRAQYLDYKEEINFAVQHVFDSCEFIMGKEVFDFENELAQYLNCKNVISCGSGTDALLLALMAIDIKPGDEIITTPFTFIATAEVICLLGATPVFVDIQQDSYNIDVSKIEEKITLKTRAIIPVSLFGQPADMDEINALAVEYGARLGNKIYVIEDAAQSLGALYKGKKSANLSDMGCMSFFPSKPLGCYGDGGAIAVKDDNLAEKIKSLRVHGQTKRYYHQYIGFNCRLDTIQAAILRVKLKYFDEELKRRSRIATYYHDSLFNCNVILPTIKSDRTSVYAQYSIRSRDRDQVIDFLRKTSIPVAVHYSKPLHLQACFRYLNYREGDMPVAEKISNEIFSIPMSAFITESQQNDVVNSIRKISATVCQDERIN